jgi:hypothetical protein
VITETLTNVNQPSLEKADVKKRHFDQILIPNEEY